MKITFYETETFEAMHAAETWCEERGISVGAAERGPKNCAGNEKAPTA